jgi:hypothetical protein
MPARLAHRQTVPNIVTDHSLRIPLHPFSPLPSLPPTSANLDSAASADRTAAGLLAEIQKKVGQKSFEALATIDPQAPFKTVVRVLGELIANESREGSTTIADLQPLVWAYAEAVFGDKNTLSKVWVDSMFDRARRSETGKSTTA